MWAFQLKYGQVTIFLSVPDFKQINLIKSHLLWSQQKRALRPTRPEMRPKTRTTSSKIREKVRPTSEPIKFQHSEATGSSVRAQKHNKQKIPKIGQAMKDEWFVTTKRPTSHRKRARLQNARQRRQQVMLSEQVNEYHFLHLVKPLDWKVTGMVSHILEAKSRKGTQGKDRYIALNF